METRMQSVEEAIACLNRALSTMYDIYFKHANVGMAEANIKNYLAEAQDFIKGAEKNGQED